MNGLAITIVIGQLPKLCGFSTDADGFVDDVRAFLNGFDERNSTAMVLGVITLAVLLVLPRFTRTIPAVLVAVVGATVVTARLRPGCRHGRVAPRRACLGRRCRGPTRRCRPAAGGGRRHHVGVADRHDRDVDELRGSPWRRGRPEPGDDRHRDGQPGSRGVPGLRGLDQRFADGRRRAVGRQEPARRAGRRVPRRTPAALLQLPACRPSADCARGGGDRRRALARRHRLAASVSRRYDGRRSCSRSWPPPASCSSACWKASSSPSRSRSCSSSSAAGGPTARCSAGSTGQEGWHSVSSAPTAEQRPGVLVYRWEAPLFFANAGMFRQQIRHLVRDRRPALGRAPVRGHHRHRRHRCRHARAARQRAERAGRPPRVRRASQRAYTTSSTGTACSRRSTATTSTTRSTRPSQPSTPRATAPPRSERQAGPRFGPASERFRTVWGGSRGRDPVRRSRRACRVRGT